MRFIIIKRASISVCRMCANSSKQGNIHSNTITIVLEESLINTHSSAHNQTLKNSYLRLWIWLLGLESLPGRFFKSRRDRL